MNLEGRNDEETDEDGEEKDEEEDEEYRVRKELG